ncbi:TPA: hypothetical protein DDZ86_03785 [Candidatus Dependentiae bacterium]|nr:MAG: hypothetical protein UW09_C0003G0111 [candidate division TM6 bacterium GW2011_GWF2_43_87]HBL98737.1 hypothetical protein [Candidatus Dependentiae bacterium]
MKAPFRLIAMLLTVTSIAGAMPGASIPGMGGMSLPSFPQPAANPGFNMASMGGNPAAGFDAANPGGPGSNQAQSENEMQEAMDFLKHLDESNNPDDIKLKKEIERMSLELSAQMSDADISQLSAAFGIPASDLVATRDDARAELAKITSQEPTANEQEEVSEDEEEAETEPTGPSTAQVSRAKGTRPSEEAVKPPTLTDKQQAKKIIEQIVEKLGSLQKKTASHPTIAQMLRSWEQELRDLNYYLQVMSSDARIDHIITASGGKLLKNLKALAATLTSQEPQVSISERTAEDSPYNRLGVKPKDSKAKIEKAYKKLKALHSAKTVEKKLKKAGASDADIKRETRLAELKLATITEDYESLIDKKSREQVDRALNAKGKELQDEINRSRAALSQIANAFSEAIFNNKILTLLEGLLQKIAPQELEQQKEMKKEEEKRRKEQAQRAKARPQQTPGGNLEPMIQLPSGQGGIYPSDSPYFPGYPGSFGYEFPGSQPSYGQQQPQQPQPQAADKKDEGTGTTTPAADAAQALAEANKLDPRPVEKIVKDLETRIHEIGKKFQDPKTDTLLDTLRKPAPRRNITPVPATGDPTEIDPDLEAEITKTLGNFYSDLQLDAAAKDAGILADKLNIQIRAQLPNASELNAWRSLKHEFEKSPETTTATTGTELSVKEGIDELLGGDASHRSFRAFRGIARKIKASAEKLVQSLEQADKLFTTTVTAKADEQKQASPQPQVGGKKKK